MSYDDSIVPAQGHGGLETDALLSHDHIEGGAVRRDSAANGTVLNPFLYVGLNLVAT